MIDEADQNHDLLFTRRDISISIGAANLYGLLIVPLLLLIALPYALIWGYGTLRDGLSEFFRLPVFLPTLVLGTVEHELIHGLSWAYVGRKPWKSIKLGFHARTLTPYAHCREPLEVRAYRISALMPCLILGIIPIVIATLTGHQWLMWFGLFFTLAAAGDLVVVWSIRGVEPGKLVQDHPSRVGCYILEPAPSATP